MVQLKKQSSTYSRCFSPIRDGQLDEVRRSYSSHHDYRLDRRQQEHNHAPINWSGDSDSESSFSSEISAGNREIHMDNVVSHRHDNADRSSADDGRRDAGVQTPTKQLKETSSQTPEKYVYRHKNVPIYDTQMQKKPTRPGMDYLKRAKAKQHRTVPARPISAPPPRFIDGPFVAYGTGDRARATGLKKTHNVKAISGVYDAAMNAAKRREFDLDQKHKEQLQKAAANEERKKLRVALFNEQLCRETQRWSTEYRSHFNRYDDNIYKRNLQSSRAPRLKADIMYLPI